MGPLARPKLASYTRSRDATGTVLKLQSRSTILDGSHGSPPCQNDGILRNTEFYTKNIKVYIKNDFFLIPGITGAIRGVPGPIPASKYIKNTSKYIEKYDFFKKSPESRSGAENKPDFFLVPHQIFMVPAP